MIAKATITIDSQRLSIEEKAMDYDQFIALINEKRQGEEAYAKLLAGLKTKAEQVYYACGAFAEKSFEFSNVWFDYEKQEVYLEYDIWIGETTHDQLKLGIREFWETDFDEAAAKVIARITAKKAERLCIKEQDERELLAELKQKYEE